MKKTRREMIITYLAKQGWSIVRPSPSRKYTVLSHPERGYRYFLGKAGAVRRGKVISKSISLTDGIDWKRIEKEITPKRNYKRIETIAESQTERAKLCQ